MANSQLIIYTNIFLRFNTKIILTLITNDMTNERHFFDCELWWKILAEIIVYQIFLSVCLQRGHWPWIKTQFTFFFNFFVCNFFYDLKQTLKMDVKKPKWKLVSPNKMIRKQLDWETTWVSIHFKSDDCVKKAHGENILLSYYYLQTKTKLKIEAL